MYVTRPLSMYKRNPAALSLPPPEGPNSGYLVIFDEEAQTYSCFGLCEDSRIKHLPFPQNKNLTITYSVGESTEEDKVIFIPVLNQPLSANCYYVIRRHGKHQGKASTSSKEEDMGTCFCCSYVKDVKPSPLDPYNIYQQFEIVKKGSSGFYAKSTTPDGFPPEFLRRKGWEVYNKTPKNYNLNEALGINSKLRAQLPDFNFPLSNDCSKSMAVGKWFCPFLFVKEGKELKEQMMSVFYEMRLEQRWDKVFSRESGNSGENSVLVDVIVQTEGAKVAGRDAVWDENQVKEGILWFESFGSEGAGTSVGLSMAIVERMRWEQERVGWSGGKERQVRVEKVEEFGGSGRWNKFGCYVLVERFVLKRMDGSLVLTYDYKHTHQIRCKWE